MTPIDASTGIPYRRLAQARAERRGAQWVNRPLCSRYVQAEFKVLSLPVGGGEAARGVPWYWALGLFAQDQYEVLGAWPAQSFPEQVARELRNRGIENIRAIVATSDIDATSMFPDVFAWSPALASSATDSRSAARTFGPRHHAVLHAAVATGNRLHTRIARTIERHGHFNDETAAAAFLIQLLEEVDRRFYETPKVSARTPPQEDSAPAGCAA